MKTERKRKLRKVGDLGPRWGGSNRERLARTFHRGFSSASIPIGQPPLAVSPLPTLGTTLGLSLLLVTFFTCLRSPSPRSIRVKVRRETFSSRLPVVQGRCLDSEYPSTNLVSRTPVLLCSMDTSLR